MRASSAGLITLAALIAAFAACEPLLLAPYEVTGIVESAGIDTGIERASVKLDDGAIVIARVSDGSPHSAGEAVRIVAQRRLLGYTSYYVVGRDKEAYDCKRELIGIPLCPPEPKQIEAAPEKDNAPKKYQRPDEGA